MNPLERARARVAALEAESKVLADTATPTAEQNARFDAIVGVSGSGTPGELSVAKADLIREEQKRAVLLAAPAVVETPIVSAVHNRAEDKPWGESFIRAGAKPEIVKSAAFGEFLQAVVAAGTPGGTVDPRLFQAGPTGLNTGVASDGGFLVRTDFSTMLLDGGYSEAVLAPRCTRIPIGADADSLEAPIVDQTSRANGSRWGGVRVYRRAEADTVTASKPKFGEWEVRLEDLMAICYATDRSLKDAVSLGAIMYQSFIEEFAFKVDDEIVRGTGVGECEGILNAAATVSVSKETGQAAATIVMENIVKMYARMFSRSRSKAAWFYNQDIEPQLPQLNLAAGTAGYPVYLPPNGLAGAPLATLYGHPLIPIEHAATLGTVGDLMLLDLSQYVLIDKGGIEQAESIHVRFLYGEKTFRWMYRINGRPKWKSALTPFKGTNTLSPFITLATRD